jgi:protocatechuate 3,4-dioxygenase beta subunit
MAHHRRYEGRPLARPDEDPADQGLGFDVGTLLSRRRSLRLLGLGAAAAGLTACGTSPSSTSSAATSTAAVNAPDALAEIPDETAGPYPGDGSNGPDVLEQSGIVRSDLRESFGEYRGTAEGVGMTLELNVTDLSIGGAPFAGVAVYVWHCTREGGYSLYSQGIEDQNYLRGVQIADAAGVVRFQSVFPGCYDGRWPHVHFEVYPGQAATADAANAIATSQVALPKSACDLVYAEDGYEDSVGNLDRISLDTDNVFGDNGGTTQLAAATGDVDGGFTVRLNVGVDPGTTPTAGGAAPPRGPGGEGPPMSN